MRIGLFTDRYVPQIDGVSISTESFRRELEELGHEVYVFAPRPTWRYKERSNRIIRFPAVKGLFWEDNLTSLFFPHLPIAGPSLDRSEVGQPAEMSTLPPES